MSFELTKEFIENVREVIDSANKNAAIEVLQDLHAADIAEIYDELSVDEAKFLYMLLDKEKASDVISELDEDDRERFLKSLPSDVIAKQFIEKMDSDDAADVIGDMDEEKQEEVLSHIEDIELAGDIVDLMAYDEDSAGGLMAKELIKVNENWTLTSCLREMRKQVENMDEVYYVYVVDDADILKGTISLKRILLSDNRKKVKDIYNSEVISVKTDTTSEEVTKIMDQKF